MGRLANVLPVGHHESFCSPTAVTSASSLGNLIQVEREVIRAADGLQWQALVTAFAGARSPRERWYCEELIAGRLLLAGDHELVDALPADSPDLGLIRACILLAGAEKEHGSGNQLSQIESDIRAARTPTTKGEWPLADVLLMWISALRGEPPAEIKDALVATFKQPNCRAVTHLLHAIDSRHPKNSDDLLTFARELVADADEGNELPLTLIEAHVLRQRRLSEHDEAMGLLYFVEEDVQYDIVETLRKTLLSPAHEPTPWTARWRSLIGYTLYLMGDYRRAREHFGTLQAPPEQFPWNLIDGNALGAFDHAKEIVCRGKSV